MVIYQLAEHWDHVAEESGAWFTRPCIHEDEIDKGKQLGTSLR